MIKRGLRQPQKNEVTAQRVYGRNDYADVNIDSHDLVHICACV